MREDILLLAETDALHGTLSGPATIALPRRPFAVFGYTRDERLARSLLQKSDDSRDPQNRQSEALEMTEIWPPAGAIAHFRAVSMSRVTLDTAVDTFATGS